MGVNIERLHRYVIDAVTVWCGSFDPTDPLFALDRTSVRVSLLERHAYYTNPGNKPTHRRKHPTVTA